MRTIPPHITGGNAPLRRRLTTREAMAHPVELPLEASVQHHAVCCSQGRLRQTGEECVSALSRNGARLSTELRGSEGSERICGTARWAVRRPAPCLRPNQAELFETLQRPLDAPALRQPGPLIAVHLARGERARQTAAGEPGRQQGGRHPRCVGDGRIEPAGVGRQELLNSEKCGNLDQRRRIRTGAVLATCDSGWLLGGLLEAALRRLEDQP